MLNSNYNLVKTVKIPYREWTLNNWYKFQSVYPSIKHNELKNYIYSVLSMPSIIYTEAGFTNIDISSRLINVFSGVRQSTESNMHSVKDKDKTNIYMFGDSRMYGVGVQDDDTLPSKLQQLCNKGNMPVNILNYGVRSDILVNIYSKISKMSFKENDIALLFMPVYASYSYTCNRPSRYGYWPLLSKVINYMNSINIPIYIFNFPDIRRIKNPSLLEKKLQYSVSVNKARVLISPDYVPSKFQPVPYYDTQDALLEIPEKYSSFWDYYHLGPLGHAAVAKFVYKTIKDKLYKDHKISCNIFINKNRENEASNLYNNFINNCKLNYVKQNDDNYNNTILSYKKYPRFVTNPSDIIGSVVMNCNPLSNGHVYLIEEALKRVDYLYIFIVNEDKSYFSFDHRLFMVRKHFANIKNINVLPSGNLMISDLTFPDYFQKDYNNDKKINAGLDMLFFCKVIAKMFNITKRFIGTEPNCQITNQYNDILKKTLPQYGIECIEIERKLNNGIPISASLIRSYIKNKDYNSIKELVPPITYDIIRNYYKDIV